MYNPVGLKMASCRKTRRSPLTLLKEIGTGLNLSAKPLNQKQPAKGPENIPEGESKYFKTLVHIRGGTTMKKQKESERYCS